MPLGRAYYRNRFYVEPNLDSEETGYIEDYVVWDSEFDEYVAGFEFESDAYEWVDSLHDEVKMEASTTIQLGEI